LVRALAALLAGLAVLAAEMVAGRHLWAGRTAAVLARLTVLSSEVIMDLWALFASSGPELTVNSPRLTLET